MRLYSSENMATTASEDNPITIDPYRTFVTLTISNDNEVVKLPTSNTVERGHMVEIYASTTSGVKRFKMQANASDGINGHSAGTRSKAIEVGIDGTLVTCKNVASAGNHSWV